MRKIYLFATSLAACLFFNSCVKTETVQSISETELFTLPYGNFEEQLSVTDLNDVGDVRFGIAMQDGFFYVVNGESRKILELNSYGDLLTLFYNEDSQTARLLDNSERPDKSIHHEISYPFDYPGMVAVDSNKNVYTVCSIPWDRQEKSDDGTTLYSHTVLRFARDGSSVDYIGQQGPGGTPFPFIKSVHATKNDELVVVCEQNEGPVVFWFNSRGYLLYKIPFNDGSVPKLKEQSETENVYFVCLEKVIPDNETHKLYVLVNYFQNYLDPATKVQSGIDYEKTMLYPLDAETGFYEEGLDIPPFEDSISENLSKEVFPVPFDFLGVTDSGWFFFMLPVDKGCLVQMVHPDGQKILKRVLNINHSEMLYYSMCLSGNGIISGLFIKNNNAQITWWRTDSLVSGFMN